MPIYEYVCEDCGNEYEKIVLNKQQAVACPRCEGTRNKLKLSVFSTGSGSSAKAAPSSSGGCCGGGCGCH